MSGQSLWPQRPLLQWGRLLPLWVCSRLPRQPQPAMSRWEDCSVLLECSPHNIAMFSDVNECLRNPCGSNAECTNTEGSYQVKHPASLLLNVLINLPLSLSLSAPARPAWLATHSQPAVTRTNVQLSKSIPVEVRISSRVRSVRSVKNLFSSQRSLQKYKPRI